jgi:hypothetical protein
LVFIAGINIHSGRLRGSASIIYSGRLHKLFRPLTRHGFYYLFRPITQTIPAAYAARLLLFIPADYTNYSGRLRGTAFIIPAAYAARLLLFIPVAYATRLLYYPCCFTCFTIK